MLPTKLTRAAHRVTASPPSTATCYACLSKRRTHQRRHSSSKASSSADRYSNKPAGPATKATANPSATPEEKQAVAAQPPETTSTPPRNTSKGRSRISRRNSSSTQDGNTKKAVPAEPVDQFAGLPSVPSVQSLSESDRSISNFFSLHRPMSIAHTFPPPSTPELFSKIFSTEPAQPDPWANGNSAERRPEDVIYTLHTTIETLENNANTSQDEGVRWEIIHESPSNHQNGNVHHLDGQPQQQQPRLKNLEELVAQFKPFRAPPPPEPFPEYMNPPSSKSQKKATSTSSTHETREGGQTKPKQKTFTTTITVTESTYANGRKTYSASSSPIVAASLPSSSRATSSSQSSGLTRRERARRLQYPTESAQAGMMVPVMRLPTTGLRGDRVKMRRRERMELISVKRQRKLKMKKHKYKKLMKRTRNLRRRLERN